ncbi:MAG: OB-fold domain-containing protein, partial [bacterium]
MISYLQGTILERKSSSLLILVGGIGYEVLVPPALLAAMPTAVEDTEVKLVIYYYLQIDQSRGVPVMIGFRQQLER